MVQGIQSGDDPVCLAVRLLACLPRLRVRQCCTALLEVLCSCAQQ